MSKFNRKERNEVYEKLLGSNGAKMQATVAIEEMSEVIKEITKMLRWLKQPVKDGEDDGE